METDPGVLLLNSSPSRGTRSRHTSADSARSYTAAPYCIPNYCDILIFSAAYSGQYSFRSPSKGSWFVQALCQEIQDSSPDEDLASILIKVSRFVALYKESNVPCDPKLHKKKQVPLQQNTLIRKVYLKDPSQVKTDKNVMMNAIKDNNCLCM